MAARYGGGSMSTRGRGMFRGLNCVSGSLARQISREAFRNGLLIETSGSNHQVLKTLCPLTINDENLACALDILQAAVERVLERNGVPQAEDAFFQERPSCNARFDNRLGSSGRRLFVRLYGLRAKPLHDISAFERQSEIFMKSHTVEKIGGTSMSSYAAVRDNILVKRECPNHNSLYQRIFVVSAYAGVTDLLLENKKSGRPGIFGLFAGSADDRNWRAALHGLRGYLLEINGMLFSDPSLLARANGFIVERLRYTESCLGDLERLCGHANFELRDYLGTIREMLASLGEAHSAWNLTSLLNQEGITARFIDLTGWREQKNLDLDERIRRAFSGIDLSRELPIVTGYARSEDGLMKTFARGYSEMTFSRVAVVTGAREAVIHKEYHLSSADPAIVGEARVVPIGRTNYDVADQLANLGMEAIHPGAAKGLRQKAIPLRVMNSFQPEHAGTLITGDYVSATPRVEIVAGRKGIYALECFDQEMMDCLIRYDRTIDDIIERFRGRVITKDSNANTITHFLACGEEAVAKIRRAILENFPHCDVRVRRVAVVSAIGSDMDVPGVLSHALTALAQHAIAVLAVHQSMRQVDIHLVIHERDYEPAVVTLHRALVESRQQAGATCAA